MIEAMNMNEVHLADEIVRLKRDLAEAVAVLELLVADVQDYEAWQRPCYAVDRANAVLAKLKGNP